MDFGWNRFLLGWKVFFSLGFWKFWQFPESGPSKYCWGDWKVFFGGKGRLLKGLYELCWWGVWFCLLKYWFNGGRSWFWRFGKFVRWETTGGLWDIFKYSVFCGWISMHLCEAIVSLSLLNNRRYIFCKWSKEVILKRNLSSKYYSINVQYSLKLSVFWVRVVRNIDFIV